MTPSAKPRAYYICGTHWDREWYEPFQEYRMWLVQNMDCILDRLQADQSHRVFHLDGQAIVIEDYLEIRPERRDELTALLRSGRLVAGPWYAMPDLWLVSGEALIRNFSRGMRVVREMGATPMPVGYCPDLFGHIASMPMIFAGFGFTGAVVWRGLNDEQVRAQFVWVAPDGSRTLTHRFPDNYGYGWFGGSLRLPWSDAGFDANVLRERGPGIIAEEAARSDIPLAFLGDGQDHQPMPRRVPEMLEILGEVCPETEFVFGSMTEYFAELAEHKDKLREFHGELRYPARATGKWYHVLIPHCLASRYPLKQANDRCQNLLTLWSEPLAALALAAGKAVAPGFLDNAWKHLLQNQPHDSICGCSIDETHDDMPYRFHQCELLGDGVRRQAMAHLAPLSNRVAALENVLVWNPLPWDRALVGEVELHFPVDYKAKGMRSGHNVPLLNQFELRDPDGRAVPYQVLSVDEGRTVKQTDLQGRRMTAGTTLDVYRLAVSLDLPAAGFTTLKVTALEGDGQIRRPAGSLRTGPLSAENEHLKVSLSAAGTVTLEHPASGRRFTDLFQYEDSGDAGDGWNFVPPIRNRVLVTPGQSVATFIEEDGPLQVTFRIERALRVPAGLDSQNKEARSAETVELHVTDFLTLRASDPVLHVRSVVDNTARDHRLRVLFPSDIASDAYWSDQPFAWVERPVAVDAASFEYKEPDPVERPHHTAFAFGDNAGGLAVLCPEGLHEHSIYEDARRTMAMTLFRAVGKTVQTDGEPGAQSLGLMEFCYAVRPFAGELPRGGLSRSVLELQAGITTNLSEENPGRQSFLQVDAPMDVVVTTIKPANDGGGMVVRLWNTGSGARDATIGAGAPLQAASLCSLAEELLSDLSLADGMVQVSVPARGLLTVRLSFAAGAVRRFPGL